MGRLCWVGFVLATFANGCVPSKEAKIAGQMGCTPEEIAISNEERAPHGFIQSGGTGSANVSAFRASPQRTRRQSSCSR
jgi:hypothetical protein